MNRTWCINSVPSAICPLFETKAAESPTSTGTLCKVRPPSSSVSSTAGRAVDAREPHQPRIAFIGKDSGQLRAAASHQRMLRTGVDEHHRQRRVAGADFDRVQIGPNGAGGGAGRRHFAARCIVVDLDLIRRSLGERIEPKAKHRRAVSSAGSRSTSAATDGDVQRPHLGEIGP